MDNRNKKKNKQQNKQNPNLDTNTEVLNAKEEKKNTEEKADNGEVRQEKTSKEDNKEKVKKEEKKKQESKKENISKESVKKESQSEQVRERAVTEISSEQIKGQAMSAAKILLPVAACAIIIAVVISLVGSKKSQTVNLSVNTEDSSNTVGVVALSDEPLAENAYTGVNELMRAFCTALADGDMDTIRRLKDYNTDREIITYAEKSEFIESYNNVNCYTKPGVEENSYFVYVTYTVKFKDIETEAPGLNAFYVYTADDGSLKIDGDTEENIRAAFKVVTSQDDVVDLYNKIDVNYNEATTLDEELGQFMADLPGVIKESVGVALAKLESGDVPQTETGDTQSTETETSSEDEVPLQNQVVDQIVRTTDTVNVRSSDSEEADKIGKVQAGTELRRIEDRINGWSKVIFEEKEAYIKSDYLEVVTSEEAEEPIDTVTALTNVNVRSQASQDSERLGGVVAGTDYKLLEEQGEWYKIEYDGKAGYVKAEYFRR